MTELRELLDYLYALQRRGIKVGLEHTRSLLRHLNNPHKKFDSIHIAGTNGKGSTAAMTASILKAAGLRVGLYTSPHLVRFNERIRVNGIPITDSEIGAFVELYRSTFDTINSTFFEVTTAMAFSCFAQQEVDVAVIETGLGGRLDATNVLTPQATVITPIGLDHSDLLGRDFATIAYEKGGILKKGVPLILAGQRKRAQTVIRKLAVQNSIEVIEVQDKSIVVNAINDSGTYFCWKGNTFHTPLIGEHQAKNAVLAIQTARVFHPQLSDTHIHAGLNRISWPGRLQQLNSRPPIYYDVAHNADGLQSVLKALSGIYPNKPVGLLAMKPDKDLDGMTYTLREQFSELIITTIPEAGLMTIDDLARKLDSLQIGYIKQDQITEAFSELTARVSPRNPGLIFGSHYIGKDVFLFFDFSFDNGVI